MGGGGSTVKEEEGEFGDAREKVRVGGKGRETGEKKKKGPK